MNRSFIARSGYRLERETFSWIYKSCRRILSSAFQLIFRILVALAGPNPEHMHDVFLATNYPKVHESLKHTTKEHVHLENPPSSSKTLSLMKNLEHNFTYGDQVINDKSQEDELGKTTMESEVESMVIVPIQQASSSAPPLNTTVIDLSSPSQNQYLLPVKNHSLQLPPPTPALQQSRTDLEMVKSWLLFKLKDYEILLQQVFNEYFNHPPRAVSPDLVAIVASRAVDPVGSPSLTTIDQDEHLLVLHQQIKKFNLKSLIKVLKNKFMDIKMHN
ncbi:hypothetical protein Tco_0686194 [Tanacetum coccineum]